MINPHTGQVLTPGTAEYDAFVKAATTELQAVGVSPTAYFANQGGGYGAQLMGNPLTNAYSTAFAENNTTAGGGQNFAEKVGGIIGFGQQQGYVDKQGMSTGKGSELSGGVSPEFAAYLKGLKPRPGTGATELNNANTPVQRAPSYTAPINQSQTKPLAVQGIAPIGQGGYSFGNRSQMRPSPYGMGGYGQSMYPYQNYGRNSMFGYNSPRNNFSFGNSQMFAPTMGMNRPQNTANATSSQFSGLNGRGLL